MPSLTFGFTLGGPAPATASVALSYSGFSNADRIELTGAQSYEVDLEMMPAAGLKALLVQVDTTDAAGSPVTTPIRIEWISGLVTKSEEISPGGFFALCSRTPVNGVTALTIITTANAVVRVSACG